jgi:thiamine-phosphate pyrophosphorylase
VPSALTVLPPLYAILDADLTLSRGLRPLDVVEGWLDAGVRLIQIRAKSWTGGPFLDLAEQVVARARPTGATVIVNDRADVARLAGADGVHVGQDDLQPADVRGILAPRQIVGLSTHSDDQVEKALREPIDYLAIGPVFRSATRMAIDTPVGEAGVAAAARRARPTGRPVVAIGGITEEHAPRVLASGAASVAVIAALLDGDPRAQARRLLAALTSPL